jgi:hypothetical protein
VAPSRRLTPIRRPASSGAEQAQLVDAVEDGVRRHRGPRPLELHRRPRRHDGAALPPVRVDALGVHDRPTSPTVAFIARAGRAPHPGRAGGRGRRSDAGKSAEHQPPLRPLAPNPAISASRTATRTAGRREQGVGRPQAGEPGTDDADVDVEVAVQARPRVSSSSPDAASVSCHSERLR